MPSTYTLISSNVLSTTAASVTFSAIPSTYTDLVLRISARTDRVTSGTNCKILVNNASNDGSYTYMYGNGASAGSGSNSSTYNFMGLMNGANQTANTFNSAEVYIPNYAGSTKKPFSVFNVNEQNSASTTVEVDAIANLYNQTTAITSLVFAPISAVNFVSGSSFYLYGIKNS
jgi:hypothetical protein